ncbi:LysR family transcriptional regulator [Variovorax paradoxus]|uniref:LysR family transcriptional regulator n=1 Tax=Variovorax paradoxus TaxID=34073 RepID=UPI0027891780|nr:LysR family transcriptional regulator [Variovorax paradoxus]MDQ0586257.1 DNA-binding transcriptional LysR family regulator [Variovorax paradoxus]
MNLRQLEHLLAVAETGSFSRAAEQLHLTQSALSRSIRMLEDDLDARLIDRMGKRNELTPLGEAVATRARRLVFEAAELRRNAELLKKGNTGEIRVGLGSGPGAMLMTPFLIHIAQQHPEVRVHVARGSIEVQLLQLRQRTLDALVIDTRGLVPAPDLRIERVSEMRAGFVCRRGHPLLAAAKKKKGVSFDDVLRYPLASTPLVEEVTQILIQHFGPRANPQQAVSLRCEEIASLIETVRVSDAIFLGIVTAARSGLETGELVELVTTPPLLSGTRFAIVTLVGRTEAPSMALFREFVAERLHD